MNRRPLAIAAGAFVIFAAAACVGAFWTGANLGSGAGAWLALAIDLAHGLFYRPLIDDTAIGGTRYFPLIFIVHAGLIRLGVDPVAGGHVIAVAAALLLVWGAFRVFEELGMPRADARLFAPLALCSSAGVFAITTIRGDLVPVALNVWGVVFTLRALRKDTIRDVAAAAAIFALAAFSKISAVYGLAGASAALVVGGRTRNGMLLMVGGLATTAALLAGANIASDGRMLEIMRACLSGGGSLAAAIRAPVSTLFVLIRQDPFCTLLLVFFGVCLVTMPLDAWLEPLTVLMLAVLALTVLLFTSPGVDINHLLDFFVFATLFVSYQVWRGRLNQTLAADSMALAVALTLGAAYIDVRHSMVGPETTNVPAVRALLRQVRDPGKPMFSADGMLPALEGERSYLLDNWMYELLRQNDPRYDQAIVDKLKTKAFGAVVLQTDPESPRTPDLYGPAFVPALDDNYTLIGQYPPYYVFAPKIGASR